MLLLLLPFLLVVAGSHLQKAGWEEGWREGWIDGNAVRKVDGGGQPDEGGREVGQ